MSGGYTPGPWRVNSMEFTAKRPQEVTFGVQAVGMAMEEANATLISAAPEMLEALEGLLTNLREGDFISATRIDNAKAAIAKARGEKL